MDDAMFARLNNRDLGVPDESLTLKLTQNEAINLYAAADLVYTSLPFMERDLVAEPLKTARAKLADILKEEI